jgi:hypothetical protein
MKGVTLILFGVLCQPGFAQNPHPGAMSDFPPYKILPGAIDEDNQPLSAASLCPTVPASACFTLADYGSSPKNDDLLPFGLRPRSQRLKLTAGGSLVLFNANCGGGSGSSDRYVLLRYESDRTLKNLLPEVVVSNQADVAAWDLPTFSPLPVFVTADFIWGGMEAHYSPHYFEIRIFLYDAASDRYILKHKYPTAHKYPGTDNWEGMPEVLEREKPKIMRLLNAGETRH